MNSPGALFLPLALLSLSAPFISAASIDRTKSERCVAAISEALTYLSFAGSQNASFVVDTCTNQPRTYSTYAASKLYCDPIEIDYGMRALDRECESEGLQRIPYKAVEPVLTDGYIEGLRVVDFREVDKGVELLEPVLISRDYFRRAYRTNEAWSLESRTHITFGNVAYWFWGSVLFIGILNRLAVHYFGCGFGRSQLDIEGRHVYTGRRFKRILSPFKPVHHLAKTHLVLPAAIGTYHQRLFYWCSIPTRIEAIVIALYYVLSVVLSILVYDVFEGNLYWDDVFTQICRYMSDRTGIMSYANLIMIWLFGGRNNVFLWATGWSFATFNLFHRAIARVATIQAVVHSIGYTVLALGTGTYAIYWPSAWWYMGVAATISMSLLLGFSSVWLRQNYYEAFLLIHIILSVVGLIGLFIHTSIFDGEYDYYLWPVVAIWILDRSTRLARLISCNVHVHMTTGQVSSTKSVVRYDKAIDLLRLDVIPGAQGLLPRPGLFFYLYQPFKWSGYENHPFTVASWSTTHASGCSVDTPYGAPLEEREAQFALPDLVKKIDDCGNGEDSAKCKLTFWIRPFNGWTDRLRTDCLRSPTRIINTTLLLEGPYGVHHKLHQYENIILVAGGTGIAAVLPHIQEHFQRADVFGTSSPTTSSLTSAPLDSLDSSTELRMQQDRDDSTRTKFITLVWAVRQEEFIYDLVTRELRPALESENIRLHFHKTGDSSSPLPASLADETRPLLSHGEVNSHSCPVRVNPGRPDIYSIVNNTLLSTYGQENDAGKTAILVCGPAGMADETRSVVHTALKRGYTRLDYFEDAFGW